MVSNNWLSNMNNMEKWAGFTSHWKLRRLTLMLLTMFCSTEVLPKKVWEAFLVNPCLPRWFLVYIILVCSVNFPIINHYTVVHVYMIYRHLQSFMNIVHLITGRAWVGSSLSTTPRGTERDLIWYLKKSPVILMVEKRYYTSLLILLWSD